MFVLSLLLRLTDYVRDILCAPRERAAFGCLSLCFETHVDIVIDSCGVYGPTLFAR